MNCYNCDTLLEENWNYCPNCKRKLRKNKIVEEEFVACDEVGKCHTCSCELNSNWNFCPVCGTSADFYSEKAFVSVPTIATNDQVTTVPPVVVPVVEEQPLVEETVVEETVVAQNSKVIYCPNCGTQATEEHLFCANCGTSLKNINNNVQSVQEEEKKDYFWIVWLILGFVGGPAFSEITSGTGSNIGLIGYAISLFSMIYAKFTYPKNKIVQVSFWVYIILSILGILYILLIFLLVYLSCSICAGEWL